MEATNTTTLKLEDIIAKSNTKPLPPHPMDLEDTFPAIYENWLYTKAPVPEAMRQFFRQSEDFWAPLHKPYERWIERHIDGDASVPEVEHGEQIAQLFDKVFATYRAGPWTGAWTFDFTNYLSDDLAELDLERQLVEMQTYWMPEVDIILGADRGGTKYRLAPSVIDLDRFEDSSTNRLRYLEMRTTQPPVRTYIGPLTEADASAQDTGPVVKLRVLGHIESMSLFPGYDFRHNNYEWESTDYCLAGQINASTGYIDGFWFLATELLEEHKPVVGGPGYTERGWYRHSAGPLGALPPTFHINKSFKAAKLADISRLSSCTENSDSDWAYNEPLYGGTSNFGPRFDFARYLRRQRRYVCSRHLPLELVELKDYVELTPVSFAQARFDFPGPGSEETGDIQRPENVWFYDELQYLDISWSDDGRKFRAAMAEHDDSWSDPSDGNGEEDLEVDW